MDVRRPFGRALDAIAAVHHLRFQPYRNDRLPNYVEKLRVWLTQFEEQDRPTAFLLATKVLFVTQVQFEFLQRRLFQSLIRRHLLNAAIVAHGYAANDYKRALPHLEEEMNASLFIGNSDSSGLNSFVHRNREEFANRMTRSLVGPDLAFWVYPAARSRDRSNAVVRRVAKQFQSEVLQTDDRIAKKHRLIVVEDFSASGSDLVRAMLLLARTSLPIKEVVIAPVMACEHALHRLERLAQRLSRSSPYAFHTIAAHVLPNRMRCFGGPQPSYLDGHPPITDLSSRVEQLSEKMFRSKFEAEFGLSQSSKHGYDNLALAFAFFSNCPDNSLPIIWVDYDRWRGLFPRASRYI